MNRYRDEILRLCQSSTNSLMLQQHNALQERKVSHFTRQLHIIVATFSCHPMKVFLVQKHTNLRTGTPKSHMCIIKLVDRVFFSLCNPNTDLSSQIPVQVHKWQSCWMLGGFFFYIPVQVSVLQLLVLKSFC